MEPNQSNQPNQFSQPINTEPNSPATFNPEPTAPSSSTASPKPKKTKTTIWCLSIIMVLAIGAAAVFAYLYFSNSNSQNQPQSQSQSQTDDTSTSPEPTTEEEVEITDTYVLRDLDEKMAILHDTTQTDATINKGRVVGGYSNPIFTMYQTGYLNPSQNRVAYVIRALESQFRHLSTEEGKAVVESVDPQYREDIIVSTLQGIDGDTVAKKYKDVFGEELVRETSDDCYAYMYNPTHDFYYQNPVGGCGGSSPYMTYHYKSKYTTNGDNAYVYVSTALTDWESNNVYCDVAYLDISGAFKLADEAKICGTLSVNADFTLDSSNYQDFSQYRFVFNKADDGTYYFTKVEKV